MRILALSIALGAASVLFAQSDRLYHEDGSLKEVRWVEEGRLEFVKYHPNGHKQERGAFVAGKPDGIWKQYDVAGKLVTRMRFEHGMRQGRCLVTNFDGSTQYRLRYQDGKLQHGAEFNGAGEMVAERDPR